jgi:hypothetical protein
VNGFLILEAGDIGSKEGIIHLPVLFLVLLVGAVTHPGKIIIIQPGGVLTKVECRAVLVHQLADLWVSTAGVIARIAANKHHHVLVPRIHHRPDAKINILKGQLGSGRVGGHRAGTTCGAGGSGILTGGIKNAKTSAVDAIARTCGVEEEKPAHEHHQRGKKDHKEHPCKHFKMPAQKAGGAF